MVVVIVFCGLFSRPMFCLRL